jgi:hypothetical protein
MIVSDDAILDGDEHVSSLCRLNATPRIVVTA